MENAGALHEINIWLIDRLFNGALLSKAAYICLCALCLFCLGVALYKQVKRRWESAYYIFLCVFAFACALFSLLALFTPSGQNANRFLWLAGAGFAPLPALLCLHTQKQVSYKEPRLFTYAALFAVPAFLWFVIGRDILVPHAAGALPSIEGGWGYFPLFCLYAAAAFVYGYLLCFSVFYQMPRRMRRSTRLVLLSVTSAAALLVFYTLYTVGFFAQLAQNKALEILLPLGVPALLASLVYSLYSALYIMPASDIIVTSREFVMGGLDTTVLVLNRQKQILDWNRREWGPAFPLPKPMFREPYEVYRRRLLQTENDRVSPHNENIVIVAHNGKEAHFFLRTHEVGNEKRKFGSLVEIVEITSVYTILRYFEGVAHYDMLTGMYNRNAYLHFVEQAVTEENMPLLIFVGDVDGLKQINDIHGHLLGDKLLTAAANVIQEVLPPGAFAARVGGDEFVVLVPNGSEQAAKQFAQDVMARCAQMKHDVVTVPAISWGYAVMQDAGQPYNDVFSEADAMMYAYKKGRHQFSSSGLVPDSAGPEPGGAAAP